MNPRLQPHLSYSSYAPAVRATTKVSQRWGLCCNLWFPQSTLWRASVPPPQVHEDDSEEQRPAGALKHYWEKLSNKRKTNKNDIIPVSFLACNTQREKKLLGSVIRNSLFCVNQKKQEAPLFQNTCKSRMPDATFSRRECTVHYHPSSLKTAVLTCMCVIYTCMTYMQVHGICVSQHVLGSQSRSL